MNLPSASPKLISFHQSTHKNQFWFIMCDQRKSGGKNRVCGGVYSSYLFRQLLACCFYLVLYLHLRFSRCSSIHFSSSGYYSHFIVHIILWKKCFLSHSYQLRMNTVREVSPLWVVCCVLVLFWSTRLVRNTPTNPHTLDRRTGSHGCCSISLTIREKHPLILPDSLDSF